VKSYFVADANNNVIPAPLAPVYYPLLQVIPPSLGSWGFDYGSSPSRFVAIQRAIATGGCGTSDKYIFAQVGTQLAGAVVFCALYDQYGNMTGGVTANFYSDQVVKSAMNSFTSNLWVNVYDYSASTSDPETVFLTSTAQPNNTLWTSAESYALMNSAPFYANSTVKFGDRTYGVFFIATNNYVNSFASFDKYTAIIVSMVALLLMLVACIFLFFSQRLQRSKRMRMKSKAQVNVLIDSQNSLRSYLARIALQEKKARTLLNSMPDFVIVTSNTGKVVQTNKKFDRQFGYTEEQMGKGVFVDNIFLHMQSGFYKQSIIDPVETLATTQWNGTINVMLMVTSIDNDDQSDVLSAVFSNRLVVEQQEQTEDQEAFVIIARPVMNNVTAKNDITSELVPTNTTQ
jgi:PAS domain-containing protein